MVGCGLVVAVVLWLWRQFGGCGDGYWVVVVLFVGLLWIFLFYFFF